MNQEEYERLVASDPRTADFLQFVSGSHRNRPFYRVKRDYQAPLSEALKKQRIAFSEAAMSAHGQKGLLEVDEVPMPVGCQRVQERLKGKRFSDTDIFSRSAQSTIGKICARWKIPMRKQPETRPFKAEYPISKEDKEEINREFNETMRKINEDYRRWLAKMRAKAQA